MLSAIILLAEPQVEHSSHIFPALIKRHSCAVSESVSAKTYNFVVEQLSCARTVKKPDPK